MTAKDFQKLFGVIAKQTSFCDEVTHVRTDSRVVTMASGKYFQARPDGIYMKTSWRSSRETKVAG